MPQPSFSSEEEHFSIWLNQFRDKVLREGVSQETINKTFKNIYLSTKVIKIEPTNNNLIVHFENKDKHYFKEKFDMILISVGREPNTSKIGLENTGIQIDDKGFILVNEKLKTKLEAK